MRLFQHLRPHLFTSHRDETKRYFAHHDMPLPIDCGLLGHRPVWIDLGTGAGFIECRRCTLRPSYVGKVPQYTDHGRQLHPMEHFLRAQTEGHVTWMPRRAESHLETSRHFVDHFAIQLKLGTASSENAIGGHLIIPGWRGWYVGTNVVGRRLANWRTRHADAADRYDSKVWGLHIDKDFVRWKVGGFRDKHTSDTPRWRDGSWNFRDTVLGKAVHSRQKLGRFQVFIDMPEGRYPALLTLEKSQWMRKRWPHPEVRLSVDVRIDGGIPNGRHKYGDWDSTWGFGISADKIDGTDIDTWPARAAQAAAEEMLKDREKYAGDRNWVPPTEARQGTRLIAFDDQAGIEAWLGGGES